MTDTVRRTLPLLLALMLFVPALALGSSLAEGAAGAHFVSGTVQDLVGVPMSGVNVSAESDGGGSLFTVLSGPDGRYNLSLPDGLYDLSASISGRGANISYRSLLVTADLGGLDFTMQVTTGRVEGHVISNNVPLVGAQVVLSNGNVTYMGTTTLPLGAYAITGIVPGVFVARAERTGYWTNVSQKPVFVVQGEATELDFMLEPQPARLFGKVTVNDRTEEGVQVSLMSGSSAARVAVTDANGNYSLSNIIAGEYQVVFSKEGLVEKTYPVSISPFEEKELSVSMSLAPVMGGKGFIDGLDLTHSMMVVGLIVAVLVMLFAIFIRMRAMKRPDLLAVEEEEEEAEPKKGKGK